MKTGWEGDRYVIELKNRSRLPTVPLAESVELLEMFACSVNWILKSKKCVDSLDKVLIFLESKGKIITSVAETAGETVGNWRESLEPFVEGLRQEAIALLKDLEENDEEIFSNIVKISFPMSAVPDFGICEIRIVNSTYR